ncbi:MAG: two-component system chemotaxis response regulator CheY [Myxococcota bacterium]|jgi:two-component system chemotaxis response regulator CheY
MTVDRPILIVDDSLMIRNMVKRALAGAGYAVLEAKDGVDAVEKLAAGAEPSLIVCDVNMPRMNGIEFLEALRESHGVRIPVVMLTTEGQPEMVRKARLLGAKGWLVKPFKTTLLLAAVEKLAVAGV